MLKDTYASTNAARILKANLQNPETGLKWARDILRGGRVHKNKREFMKTSRKAIREATTSFPVTRWKIMFYLNGCWDGDEFNGPWP